MVLICVFQWQMMLHIFYCIYLPSIYLLAEISFEIFCIHFNVSVYYLSCSAGDQTQSLLHARQTFYEWATSQLHVSVFLLYISELFLYYKYKAFIRYVFTNNFSQSILTFNSLENIFQRVIFNFLLNEIKHIFFLWMILLVSYLRNSYLSQGYKYLSYFFRCFIVYILH